MAFKEYAAELQRNLKSGHATEPTYYPALKSLLESLDPSLSVLQNPKKTEHGSPDFRVVRKKTIDFPVGWIEAKEPGVALDKIEKSDQIKRYLHLPNLILTDFLEFRWYTDGKPRLSASLGVVASGKCKFEADGQARVEELLGGFLAHKTPPAKDSRDLARRMAQLAHFIREAILIAHDAEKPTGILHQQMDAFREALIPDLDSEQFADMYAQTIAYGLFAARCQPNTTGEKFTREHAAYLIPKTNPFLRKLFSVIAGPDLPDSILPYVDDLVALLRDTDIGAIMAEWGKRTGKEDPVVHFYEDFLQAYDPKLRELRGVYYTPEPVVSYIVRSIDHILKTEFSKPMGLADKDVLILDPACGTGTFLYFVIRHIHDILCQHGQKGQWNSYVSENLLKRIFGFELLMAPYAVAHLKLGLLLHELNYKFESDERLGIYLTNTLEQAAIKAEVLLAQWIADEANSAGAIKRDKPIMVVLGNPPYSGISPNRGEWIEHLVEDYKRVDGKPLGERKHWLQDDYVKFIRFAQWRIEQTGYGVVGFVTNHGYLDNPTFRGMRNSLLSSFPLIRVVDLHGNSKKQETSPDGSIDRNVFDIQQGVAISIYEKPESRCKPSVLHADCWGEREHKYKWLSASDVSNTDFHAISPVSPSYLLVPRSDKLLLEWQKGCPINEIFTEFSSGITSARDDFVMDFDQKALKDRIEAFMGVGTDSDARQTFDLTDTRGWKLPAARLALRSDPSRDQRYQKILYRPFDNREIIYAPYLVDWPREAVMHHMIAGRNLALLCARPQSISAFSHIFCTRFLSDQCTASNKSSGGGNCYTFPLFLYPARGLSSQWGGTQVNLRESFTEAVAARLEKNANSGGAQSPEPTVEGILGYIYAVLHSPTYRSRYSPFLRNEYPRIQLTSNRDLFAALCKRGEELVSLHLLESRKLSRFITKYEQPGNHEVKKVRYAEPNPKAGIKAGRVYINDVQYFEGVPKEVWEFEIGGYQVCEKWLKDRKGRKLSSDDIDHYQKIVVALAETICLMREIDEIIPCWPLP